MTFCILEYFRGIALYLSIPVKKKLVYLNKYAFIKSFSLPQYFDVSSVTQLTFKRLYLTLKSVEQMAVSWLGKHKGKFNSAVYLQITVLILLFFSGLYAVTAHLFNCLREPRERNPEKSFYTKELYLIIHNSIQSYEGSRRQ